LEVAHPQRASFEKNYALVTKHHIMHALQASFPKEIPSNKEVQECLRESEAGAVDPHPHTHHNRN
jgi:hypothetical protein